MNRKIILPALMVLGLSFACIASEAKTSSLSTRTSPTTELSKSDNTLTVSTAEANTTVSENSSVINEKQKPVRPNKKAWEDRTLAGKILIVTGGVIFVILALMFGTVSVG